MPQHSARISRYFYQKLNKLREQAYMETMEKVDNKNLFDNIIIPPRPSILLMIQQAQEQDAGLVEITELIAQDIGLSAAVLKTVNSSYYSLVNKVTSLKQAVSLLGIKQISMLVTGLSLRKISGTLNFDMFWRHSVEIAVTSVFIAKHLGGINIDDAQLFGLFHDCGKILLPQQFNDHQDTLKIATGLDQSVVALERHNHGADHSLVGALLSHTWCLPTTITVAIKHHHDITVFRDGNVSDHILSLLALNHLSEYLTNHNNDYTYNEWSIHADQFMECLHITENDLTNLHSEVNELLTHLGD
jgi:HD-like signal output (HDOD) protein